MLRYSKKYISEWDGNPYCNYVESEWRHVIPNSIVEWIDGQDKYHEWRGDGKKRPVPTAILESLRLTFSAKDVLGVIINDLKDIGYLHLNLKSTEKFGGKYHKPTEEEIAYIESKIITIP